MSSSPTTTSPPAVDALLADGHVVQLRAIGHDDETAVRTLHHRIGDESRYLRFFAVGRHVPDDYVDHLIARIDDPGQIALGAWVRGELVALATSAQIDDDTADVAFLVDDTHHRLGIGTLLLEHLAAAARARGLHRLTAVTLPTNTEMLAVFRRAGLPVRMSFDEGVEVVGLDLAPDERAIDVAGARESLTEFRSLRPVLAPTSVVVVGAGANEDGLGRLVCRTIVDAAFTGRLAVVNRTATRVAGVDGYASLLDVPHPVDTVIVAVPADAVLDVAHDAASIGARGLVVVSSGFADAGEAGAARQRELLTVCRRASIRLIGPNCMGIANAEPDVRLDATFTPVLPPPGRVGFASQSGAIGIAFLEQAQQAGFGVSSVVSAGNKADVSGNDLLCYWEHDPATAVCALYLESFGNPRKFGRIARRVGRSKPVIVVTSGHSEAGARGIRSHTAAAATPDVAVGALFRQAGVIRAGTMGELLDLAAFFDLSPIPAGRQIAIVGNSGGPQTLAADAAAAAGLVVPALAEPTQQALRALAPAAAVSNPVDLGAAADATTLRSAVDLLVADEDVAAVIAVVTPVLPERADAMLASITDAAAASTKPVVLVTPGLPVSPAALRDEHGRNRLPWYALPECAARVLAAAAEYAEWLARPATVATPFGDVDRDRARSIVREALDRTPAGGWLDADAAAALLAAYRIPVAATTRATTVDDAVAAADRLGWPVALKAASGAVVHKSEVGAVRVGVADEEALRTAYREVAATAGPDVVIQPMVDGEQELAAGIVSYPPFGPVVMFATGGIATDLLADRAFAVTPLTDDDAHRLVRGLRASPLLFGYRGQEPIDVPGLEELLIRVGQLADDLPELAEADLNPIVASPHGLAVVDAKVRIVPATPIDWSLRALRR